MWRSNQLSYRTVSPTTRNKQPGLKTSLTLPCILTGKHITTQRVQGDNPKKTVAKDRPLQKGGVPAAPSGTATLLRLSPNHRFYPRALLAVTHFRYPRLSWLDGRCVQGPGTYWVADSSPNWEGIYGSANARAAASLCTPHCNTCVAPDVRAVLI